MKRTGGIAFSRDELNELRYLSYVGPAGPLLRAYIELLLGRAITDAEYEAVLSGKVP